MEREQTTIRLPAELKRDIEKEADEKNISFNEMISILLFNAMQSLKIGGN